MKLTMPRNVSNLKDVQELGRFVQISFEDIENIINGNVEFGENINAKQLDVNFQAINADTVVKHGLGRPPSGFIVVGLDVASIIYKGATESTVEVIYLKSTVICNATILVY